MEAEGGTAAGALLGGLALLPGAEAARDRQVVRERLAQLRVWEG